MAIETDTSIRGFFVGDFHMRQTKDGRPMLSVRVGQDRSQRLEDGTWEKLEPEFFNIVQFRGAQETFARFQRGDRFVAQGRIQQFEYENRQGQHITGEEFLVTAIGPDTATTRFTIDRNPRNGRRQGTAQGVAAGADAPEATPATPGAVQGEPAGPQQASPAPPSQDPAAADAERARKLATIPSGGISAPAEPQPAGAGRGF